jgi:hypothetical protein
MDEYTELHECLHKFKTDIRGLYLYGCIAQIIVIYFLLF